MSSEKEEREIIKNVIDELKAGTELLKQNIALLKEQQALLNQALANVQSNNLSVYDESNELDYSNNPFEPTRTKKINFNEPKTRRKKYKSKKRKSNKKYIGL